MFKNNNYLLLHLLVFIWGFTGILGKAISLEAIPLIWYRFLIAVPAIFIYLKYKKTSLSFTAKSIWHFFIVGVIITVHWFCFYHAIKVSNVSATLAGFSCGALFTALIEPLFYKRRIDWIEIAFGVIVIAALSLILIVETKYAWGIFLGILAALTSALFSVINGLLIRQHKASIITFYELLTGLIILTVYLLLTSEFSLVLSPLSTMDLIYLLILGMVCTAFTFIAGVDIAKTISPYTINLTLNLEVIYGIVLAFFLFGEDEKMTPQFYLATIIIIGTLFANAYFNKLRAKRRSTAQVAL